MRPGLRAPLLVSLLFSSLVATSFAGAGERATAPAEAVRRTYGALDKLFHRYYPAVVSELRGEAMHFDYDTRVFLIHHALKTGEWQDAREERGPNRRGILCDIEARSGRYPGAAVVPQTFDERYFELFVAAPYAPALDRHLYVHLSYPAGTDRGFLEEFQKIVDAFGK